MARVKKINVLALAKFHAALFALLGLLLGIVYSFGGLIVDILVSIEWVSSVAVSTPGLSAGTVLAFGALIGMPLVFAIVGLIVGLVEALLYNLFAKWLGGLELDFEQ